VWLKITKHLGPAFFLTAAVTAMPNGILVKIHVSWTPTLIKKKIDGHKICFKGKKKQLKRKEKGWVPLPWVQFFQSVIKV
jgi:hypothetical protein